VINLSSNNREVEIIETKKNPKKSKKKWVIIGCATVIVLGIYGSYESVPESTDAAEPAVSEEVLTTVEYGGLKLDMPPTVTILEGDGHINYFPSGIQSINNVMVSVAPYDATMAEFAGNPEIYKFYMQVFASSANAEIRDDKVEPRTINGTEWICSVMDMTGDLEGTYTIACCTIADGQMYSVYYSVSDADTSTAYDPLKIAETMRF
jgi:hypothetical protein